LDRSRKRGRTPVREWRSSIQRIRFQNRQRCDHRPIRWRTIPAIPKTGAARNRTGYVQPLRFPFCDQKGIVFIRDFENKDVCSQFTESWRQLRRNTGEFLAITTRKTELDRFRTFLRECVENDWMAKSGADKIRLKKEKTAETEERFGLELSEYEQMIAAPDSTDLTAQQNQETRVATELMCWTGMRISDAHKFNASEILGNEQGNGWNADFIQKKTKKRCLVPIPDHVVEMLNALPGQIKQGKVLLHLFVYGAANAGGHAGGTCSARGAVQPRLQPTLPEAYIRNPAHQCRDQHQMDLEVARS
jgi:integrase